jgi:hypothetical protein
VEEFDRLKALRQETPNEPILDAQPEQTEPAAAPDETNPNGYPLDSARRLQQSRVGRAPSPARRPLPPHPAAGRKRPARSRGTAPSSRTQRQWLSERDTHSNPIPPGRAAKRRAAKRRLRPTPARGIG